MNFSKKIAYSALCLLVLTISTSNIMCDDLKTKSIKLTYQLPYLPAITIATIFTKFLNTTAFKKIGAFSITAVGTTFLCQNFSEKYLKNNLNCFEWMTLKTPPFKAKTDELLLKFKNLFTR